MRTRLPGTDQVALVTGGARGIGSALCERLAEEGAMVAVNYRSDSKSAEGLVDRLRSAGARAIAVKADLCDPDEAERAVRRTAAEFGTDVSILVNNVGEFILGATAETSARRWRFILDSNLNSAYYATKAALPGMRVRGFGRVITLGLAPALEIRGAPNLAAYTVAKTGIAVFTRSLASEEARHGITVNCVAPGLIDNGHLPPEQARWMAKRVPAGRLGSADDIADAVAFLVSDRAGYISGATLSVSGGWDWGDRAIDHDEEVTALFAEAPDEAANA